MQSAVDKVTDKPQFLHQVENEGVKAKTGGLFGHLREMVNTHSISRDGQGGNPQDIQIYFNIALAEDGQGNGNSALFGVAGPEVFRHFEIVLPDGTVERVGAPKVDSNENGRIDTGDRYEALYDIDGDGDLDLIYRQNSAERGWHVGIEYNRG